MRIISRLDIKSNLLIKSVKFDGVKKIGDPKILRLLTTILVLMS